MEVNFARYELRAKPVPVRDLVNRHLSHACFREYGRDSWNRLPALSRAFARPRRIERFVMRRYTDRRAV